MATPNLGITLAETTDQIDVATHITTPISTIDAMLNATTPSTQAFADAAAGGVVTTRAARSDHKHAMPAGVTYANVTAVAWTSFSGVIGVTQGSAVTVTVDYATYLVLGKLAVVQFRIQITSAGTAGNHIKITGLPAAIVPRRTGGSAMCGSGMYLDAGSRYLAVAFESDTTTELKMVAGDAVGSYVGLTPAITAANTDYVAGSLSYEIA